MAVLKDAIITMTPEEVATLRSANALNSRWKSRTDPVAHGEEAFDFTMASRKS